MSLQVRPAQLRDLAGIEALYRQQVREAERAPVKRQFASSRLWFLLNNAFASILPITSPADHVYVMEDERRLVQGFIQAENAAARPARLADTEPLPQPRAGPPERRDGAPRSPLQ